MKLRELADDFVSAADLDSIPYPGHAPTAQPRPHPGRPGRAEKIAASARRQKSTGGQTLTPYELRDKIASARSTLRDLATDFDLVEDTLKAITTVPPHPDDVDGQGITTAAALEQSGAPVNVVAVARAVKEQLIAEGWAPRLPRRPRTTTERPSTALASWMLAENTRQAMTRWFGLMIDGVAQPFRLFRKHLKDGPPGEKATWLVRDLAGEAWRLVKIDRDPPFGPGRPLKLVHGGNVTINGPGGEGRWEWREAPNSKTLLGVLHNPEKGMRFALVRTPEFDVPAEQMTSAEARGEV